MLLLPFYRQETCPAEGGPQQQEGVAANLEILEYPTSPSSCKIHAVSCLSLTRLRNIPVPPSSLATRSGNGHLVAPSHSSGERVVVSSVTHSLNLEDHGHPLVGSISEAWARTDRGPVWGPAYG